MGSTHLCAECVGNMNTRDMLDQAIDLLYKFELLYQNSRYLCTSEQELSQSLKDFLDRFEEM